MEFLILAASCFASREVSTTYNHHPPLRRLSAMPYTNFFLVYGLFLEKLVSATRIFVGLRAITWERDHKSLVSERESL
jgi:hypothetical protein